MSGHHDPIEDNIDSHPVKLAIIIVIGTFALIVGLILLAQFAVGMYGSRSLKDDPSMKAEAVTQRLGPVAKVEVDPNAPATPAPTVAAAAPATGAMPAAVIPPPAAKAAGGAADGKATYDAVCAVCHTAGVAAAPKPGDKAAWAPRLKQGKDALYAAALKGKGAMPPKGGNPALSDDAVRASVDHLLATVK